MNRWLPIEVALHDAGTELLGSRWSNGVMTKEPFVTFWSPTMGKFYNNPTHWIQFPDAPEDA